MILVDSSIWIDHFRSGNTILVEMLSDARVLCHPFIIGELALGDLRQFHLITASLSDLPRATTANDQEMIAFIESHRLHGSGIGYVDAHLIASITLTPGSTLWTRDKRLAKVAARLGIAAEM